jgi:hypothetical protein
VTCPTTAWLLFATVWATAWAAAWTVTGAGCRRQAAQPPPAPGSGATPARLAPAPRGLPTFDLWYRIQADGQAIGFRHVTLSAPASAPARGAGAGAGATSVAAADLRLTSEQQTRLVAGGKHVTRALRLTERCAADGTLRHLATERDGAKGRKRRHYTLRGQTLTITDPDSGSARQVRLPAGAPVSGLCGLYLALHQGVDTHVLRTLDPRTGEVVTGHLLRRPGSTDRYRYSESHQPAVRTDLVLGPERLPVRQTVRGLGMTLRLTLASRAEALALVDKAPVKTGRALAIDLGARLPEPLDARRIRYALTLARPLPSAVVTELGRGNQRRLPGADPTQLLIDVRRRATLPVEAAALPYPLPAAQLRPVAAWMTHPAPALPARDSRRVQVTTLLQGEKTALRAVLRLTAWASIAHTRGFVDRASLLVAALRAARIPARLAFGFLYVGSVMTEHTWVEAHLGQWLGLDPETGGAAGATHLRLVTSAADPRRAPAADWRLVRPELRGLRARLVEAELASGFHFVPGAQANASQVANVLYHRVWGLVVRRPLTARYILPGAGDSFELAVVSTTATARLELQLFAASPGGLDARAFLNMGYRPRRIGTRDYLVKDLKPAARKPGPRDAKTQRRSYVQLSCSTKPWGARLVRWTLTAHGAPPAQLTDLETKTHGTFHMTGHPAGARGCAAPKTTR